MSIVDFMRPLIQDIDSKLQQHEKEETFARFCSVYGRKYSSRENLLSLLELCVQENKISPWNTLPLEDGLSVTAEKKDEIAEIIKKFKDVNKSAIAEWEGRQGNEFIGRDLGQFGNILERNDCMILWGKSFIIYCILLKMCILPLHWNVHMYLMQSTALDLQFLYMDNIAEIFYDEPTEALNFTNG